ncbi:MAG: hypothetical protein ABIJ09_09480 [Pseudomonadota bacterium]
MTGRSALAMTMGIGFVLATLHPAVAAQPEPAGVEVNLGQVCRGLLARGSAEVMLRQVRTPAERRIRSGRPATELWMSLAPVEGEGRLHRLEVVLHPRREGRIGRTLTLPGSKSEQDPQVTVRAQVVDCGVEANTTQELALFLDAPRSTGRQDGSRREAEAGADTLDRDPGSGPTLPGYLFDRRRAVEQRRRWCEQRRDPYDTLYLGSGFAALPWLSQPGWVYVSTQFDQSAPVGLQPAVWTRAGSLPSHLWPRYQMPEWVAMQSIHAEDLPRMRSMGPYTVGDCRPAIRDDHYRWAEAQPEPAGGETGGGDGSGGGSGAPAAGSAAADPR